MPAVESGVADPGTGTPRTARGETRGTQSFVQILGMCWRRPSLLALELLWRWSCGIPLLALLEWEGRRIWAETAQRLKETGVFEFTLQYPMQGALQISDAIDVLKPPVLHAAAWLLPLAMVLWAIAAGLGRNAVVRRYRKETPWRPAAMVVLQLLRTGALVATYVLWVFAVRWAAHFTLAHGSTTSDAGGEPNLVLYCALVIVFSLGIFTVWALLSWVFSIAPLLTLLEGRGVGSSLARSLRLGPLAGKLVEINLVMGIAKLGMIVLAMVFSATPLPFETVVHGSSLYLWWAAVTVLYLVASDFFQVARIASFVELWGLAIRADAPPAH
ncbi:MAG TPA: hypothetical protein VL990_18110 [Acidobacteriaceae bacterium]|nr:hypothetical protein [Acidobacteriaceae bacterium]